MIFATLKTYVCFLLQIALVRRPRPCGSEGRLVCRGISRLCSWDSDRRNLRRSRRRSHGRALFCPSLDVHTAKLSGRGAPCDIAHANVLLCAAHVRIVNVLRSEWQDAKLCQNLPDLRQRSVRNCPSPFENGPQKVERANVVLHPTLWAFLDDSRTYKLRIE